MSQVDKKKVICNFCKKQYVSEKTLKTHLTTCVKKILKEDEEEDMKRENELKQSFEATSKDKDIIIQELKDRIEILLFKGASARRN